jgi:hypothetical protein
VTHGPDAARLQELLDRDEIHQVVQALARGTDRLDKEQMAGCYWPDGFDDHNSFRGNGEEFAGWVCQVLPHFQSTTHFIAAPRIRIDGDVAQVDTYCVAHHVSHPDDQGAQTDMVLGLRYVDRFERRLDGGRPRWLIAKRVCAFDWTYTIEVDANRSFRFEDDFTVGQRDRTDITYTGV